MMIRHRYHITSIPCARVLFIHRPPMSAANEPTADVLIPINPEGDDTKAEVATPEICCYAFDALFCQLTKRESVPPKASDEK